MTAENYVAGIGGTESMLPHFEKVFAEAKTLDEKAPFEIRKVDQILPAVEAITFPSSKRRSRILLGPTWSRTYRNTHHTQYDTFDTVVPNTKNIVPSSLHWRPTVLPISIPFYLVKAFAKEDSRRCKPRTRIIQGKKPGTSLSGGRSLKQNQGSVYCGS